ncbi:unnamed protein product [Prunus armeniaca]
MRARRSAAAQQASPPPGTFVEQLVCIQGGFNGVPCQLSSLPRGRPTPLVPTWIRHCFQSA